MIPSGEPVQRFYASTYGRFNTPDPYQASGGPKSPASWNRYSYTRGDPVNRFDPRGRIDCDPDDYECQCSDPASSYFASCGSGDCGDGFLDASCSGSGGGGGGVPPPAPPPAPPLTPQCDVELNTRPVYASGGFGTHSYLEVWGSSGMENTLEGGPSNGGLLNTFTPGVLRSFDTVNGFEYPDDLPADQGSINAISCTQANALIVDDLNFSTTLTYSATGLFGPNSNSFLHWLINTGGLSSLYPNAPFGAVGWNNPVQPPVRPAPPIVQKPPFR
jgi:hypothetical protein